MKDIIIPITETARKYGYIIWKRKDEEQMTKLFNNKDKLTFLILGNSLTNKVDYKRRRIAITYTISRSINKKYNFFKITKQDENTFLINFKV